LSLPATSHRFKFIPPEDSTKEASGRREAGKVNLNDQGAFAFLLMAFSSWWTLTTTASASFPSKESFESPWGRRARGQENSSSLLVPQFSRGTGKASLLFQIAKTIEFKS